MQNVAAIGQHWGVIMTDIPRLSDLEDTMDFADEQRKINQINLVDRACAEYERVRYGNDHKLSFNAALDIVLNHLGL